MQQRDDLWAATPRTDPARMRLLGVIALLVALVGGLGYLALYRSATPAPITVTVAPPAASTTTPPVPNSFPKATIHHVGRGFGDVAEFCTPTKFRVFIMVGGGRPTVARDDTC